MAFVVLPGATGKVRHELGCPEYRLLFWGFDAVSAAFSRRVDVYLVALEIYV